MTASEYAASTVLRAWDETPLLRGLRLELGERARGYTTAGQVVKVRVELGEGQPGEGYFALAQAPGTAPEVELLVKRGSTLADAIVSRAVEGARVEVSAPFGRGFPVDQANGRHVLMFAAGSGIAPIRALGEVLIARRQSWGRGALYYGQREPDHFAYQDAWPRWRTQGFEVNLCCTRPDEPWTGERGRVQSVAVARDLDGIAPADAVAFLCGPKQMVADVRHMLTEAGLAEERTFVNF